MAAHRAVIAQRIQVTPGPSRKPQAAFPAPPPPYSLDFPLRLEAGLGHRLRGTFGGETRAGAAGSNYYTPNTREFSTGDEYIYLPPLVWSMSWGWTMPLLERGGGDWYPGRGMAFRTCQGAPGTERRLRRRFGHEGDTDLGSFPSETPRTDPSGVVTSSLAGA